MSLAVISTHPVQYQAPVYRALQTRFDVPTVAIYGSDFSVAGYHDQEFGATFAWDTDLLAGYTARFLSRVADGGARSAEEISAHRLPGVLREVHPAAVLLTGYSPRFYQQAFYHAWRAGYPLLFRAETTDHARSRSRIKQLARDTALRWLYRRCQRLLYVGERSRAHYRRLGCPASKSVFSPYCIDTSTFDTAESQRETLGMPIRHALELAPNRVVVLFSGKLVSRKAPDLLLRALKQLSAAMREQAAVVFLGDGPLQASLRALAEHPPAVDVRFLGFQNQSTLSQYYHAADLLVLPSGEGETWGLVVNEALHHGVPCVVSDHVGCAPDLVEPGVTGEIFESGSAHSLAQALQRAFSLTGRPDVREQCRRQVSGYTVEKAAAGIARAYWSVVAGHPKNHHV